MSNASQHNSRRRLIAVYGLVICFLAIVSCGKRNDYVAPPDPVVTVSNPAQKAVTRYWEFTGMTQSSESVDVRARVEGYLLSINFNPGDIVKNGDLLFVIDPKPYQAKLDSAKAELDSAQAQYTAAQAQYVRKQSALQSKAVSEFDVIQAKANADAAAAAIENAKADIETAQLNLGYTQVTSPIDGKVSRNQVDAGNLVGAGEATLLTNVVKNNPMYAYFNIGERDLLDLRRGIKGAGKGSPNGVRVTASLADEGGFPHEGQIDFADNRLDPSTGTLQMRAVFPNAEYQLFSGLFIRVRIPLGEPQDSLLVPERCVLSDQGGRYLLLVKSDNSVEQRSVQVGATDNGMSVIESGLNADDVVVVNGMQRARPGSKVNPQKAPSGTPAAPAPAKNPVS